MPTTTEYLRKRSVMRRYDWSSPRSVDRAVVRGQLPPPEIYMGGAPLWNEETLDAADAARAQAMAADRIKAVEWARDTARTSPANKQGYVKKRRQVQPAREGRRAARK